MYENDGGLLSPRDAYRLMLKDYPDVMDIGQMCEALGVSTKTGYKLLKDGKIEYMKSHTLRGCEILDSMKDDWDPVTQRVTKISHPRNV